MVENSHLQTCSARRGACPGRPARPPPQPVMLSQHCIDQDSESTSFAKLTTGAAFFMRSLRSKKWLERIETAPVLFPTARRFQQGMVEQQSPPCWRAVNCAVLRIYTLMSYTDRLGKNDEKKSEFRLQYTYYISIESSQRALSIAVPCVFSRAHSASISPDHFFAAAEITWLRMPPEVCSSE